MRVSTIFAVLTFAILTALCDASVLPAAKAPLGWKDLGPGESLGQERLSMTLALRRRNMEALEQIFWDVSDPTSERYGEHLGHEEMRELVSPGPAALAAVTEWLQTHGIETHAMSLHEDSIVFSVSQLQVEKLLRVRFHVFEHHETKQRVARALGAMTLPDDVAAAIEIITGHRGFPRPRLPGARKARTSTPPLGSPQTNVTPALLYSVYNVSYVPTTPKGQRNIQSFFQTDEEFVDPSDLSAFCGTLVPSLGESCKITRYVGTNESTSGIQSSWDAEYLLAMGHGAETWAWSYPSFAICDNLAQWSHDVLSAGTNGSFPHVVSISYGWQELIPACTEGQVHRLSMDMMKMGAMGVTVLISSGGNGAGQIGNVLSAGTPGTSPYCTSVGATTFVSGNSGTQRGASFSGGGFSNDFSRPIYQEAAVTHFFEQSYKLPPAASYNATGRGQPDGSLLGEGYNVLTSGYWFNLVGTPVSSFAGFVTLLNSIRLQVGKTMGFINPFLYQNPRAFTDITEGTSDFNHTGYGWYAVRGWDPLTGLGTPNWGRLADAVQRLNAAELQRAQQLSARRSVGQN